MSDDKIKQIIANILRDFLQMNHTSYVFNPQDLFDSWDKFRTFLYYFPNPDLIGCETVREFGAKVPAEMKISKILTTAVTEYHIFVFVFENTVSLKSETQFNIPMPQSVQNLDGSQQEEFIRLIVKYFSDREYKRVALDSTNELSFRSKSMEDHIGEFFENLPANYVDLRIPRSLEEADKIEYKRIITERMTELGYECQHNTNLGRTFFTKNFLSVEEAVVTYTTSLPNTEKSIFFRVDYRYIVGLDKDQTREFVKRIIQYFENNGYVTDNLTGYCNEKYNFRKKTDY